MNTINDSIIDYPALMDSLGQYRFPRNRISLLLRKGALIRVKKGLYVRGALPGVPPYSREILANLIYGPSYCSLEWALAHYGIIPERVETITSVTIARNRAFTTPLGRFTYTYLRDAYYPHGITRFAFPDGRGYLIATPEKALIDRVYFQKGLSGKRDVRNYLLDNLRIDPSSLAGMDKSLLRSLLARYPERHMRALNAVLEDLHE